MNHLKNIVTGEAITFSALSPSPDLSASTSIAYVFSGIQGDSITICKNWRKIKHIQDMEMMYHGQLYKLEWWMPQLGQRNPSQFIMEIGSIDPI